MSHIIRDVQVIVQEKIAQREPVREFIRAIIVSYEGNIRVPGHPEKVWCSELGSSQSLIPATNYSVQDIEGLPVILGWRTKRGFEERVIISLDSGALTEVDLSTFGVGPHNTSHEWSTEATPSADAVRIFQPALMPLKTSYSTGALTVGLNPLNYISGGRLMRFPGQQLNLSGYLPASGYQKYVLTYLNKNTNSAAVLEGGTVTLGAPLPRPTLPGRYAEPSALIKLVNGQVGVTTADYTDVRGFLGADAASIIPATETGQILYSDNGLDVAARIPLTNSNGIMVNDQGIIIVV